MTICPVCEEPLKGDAVVCTHCGHQLRSIPSKAVDGARPTPNALKMGCGVLIIALFVILFWYFSTAYGGA
jgi:hypothetical protein